MDGGEGTHVEAKVPGADCSRTFENNSKISPYRAPSKRKQLSFLIRLGGALAYYVLDSGFPSPLKKAPP